MTAIQNPVLQGIERNALRLRERILRGECPYPDALQDVNERVIDTLQRGARDDVPSTVAALQARVGKAHFAANSIGFLQMASTLALGIFAYNCGPLLSNAVVVASGAVGICTLSYLRKDLRRNAEANAQAARQLQAWSTAGDNVMPRLVPWRGPMSQASLRNFTSNFAQDVEATPYGSVLTTEHERVMSRLSDSTTQSVDELSASLLARSREIKAGIRSVVSAATQAAVPAALAAGGVAYITYNFWPAMAMFAVGAAAATMNVMRSNPNPNDRAILLRDARSLHYWEVAMAAVPQRVTEATRRDATPAPRVIEADVAQNAAGVRP